MHSVSALLSWRGAGWLFVITAAKCLTQGFNSMPFFKRIFFFLEWLFICEFKASLS